MAQAAGVLGKGIQPSQQLPHRPRPFDLEALADTVLVPDDDPRRADLDALGVAVAGIAGVLDFRHRQFRGSFHLDLDIGTRRIKHPEPPARAGKLAEPAADAALRDHIDALDLFLEDAVGAGSRHS